MPLFLSPRANGKKKSFVDISSKEEKEKVVQTLSI